MLDMVVAIPNVLVFIFGNWSKNFVVSTETLTHQGSSWFAHLAQERGGCATTYAI